MLQITNLHATIGDKSILKGLAFATLLLASPAVAQGDGWAHDMKPPPPEKRFKTPYDVLVYTNQTVSGDELRTVTFTSDAKGNVAIDVVYPLSKKTNPVIALFQNHYVLHGSSAKGWTVADLRSRWKCRYGDTQSWQWRNDACPTKAR
jgi:hypothetical protein